MLLEATQAALRGEMADALVKISGAHCISLEYGVVDFLVGDEALTILCPTRRGQG